LIRRRAKISLAFEIVLPLLLAIVITILASKFGSMGGGAAGKIINPDAGGMQPPTMYNNSFFQLSSSWNRQLEAIYYTPRNKFTNEMAVQIPKTYKSHVDPSSSRDDNIAVTGFDTEDSMVEAFNNDTKSYVQSRTCVVFQGTSDDTDIRTMSKLRYKLRSASGNVPDPDMKFPPKWRNGPRMNFLISSYTDSSSGFASVQTLLNEAFLDVLAEAKSVSRVKTKDIEAFKYPYPSYYESKFSFIILVPVVVVFGFIVTFPIIVKRVTEEKMNKSREMFRMMGMSDWVYWLTTILMYLIILEVQCLIIAIMFSIKFSGWFAVINAINPVLTFFILTIYGINFVLFALLVAIPFSRPVLGVVVSLVIWVITYSIPIAFLDPSTVSNIDVASTHWARVVCCLLPNFSVSIAMKIIQQVENHRLMFRIIINCILF